VNRRVDALQEAEEAGLFDGSRPNVSAETPNRNGNGYLHPRIPNDEALRLVHQVFLPNSERPPSIVVFAGIDDGDGCKQISTDVAETLANDALRSVCLVDGNFRSPVAAGLSFVNQDGGLAEALVRKGPIRSFARRTDLPANLWALPMGKTGPEAAGLLASGSLRERMAEMRTEFDFVIINAPPLARYSDAIALGQLSDGLIIVVEAGATRRDQAAQAVAGLRASGVTILAAVLDQYASPLPETVLNHL
jgi:Mrp family chromosome partitioning ATPase